MGGKLSGSSPSARADKIRTLEYDWAKLEHVLRSLTLSYRGTHSREDRNILSI